MFDTNELKFSFDNSFDNNFDNGTTNISVEFSFVNGMTNNSVWPGKCVILVICIY